MSASMFEPSRFITAFKLYLLSDFSQRTTTPLTRVWSSAFKGLERALKLFRNSRFFWFPLTDSITVEVFSNTLNV
jgi:hypothetical protein